MIDMPAIQNGKSFDVEKAAREALIDTKKILDKPPTCLAIRQGTEEIGVCSLGDFSLVVGKAKSRKSTLVSMITAALISNTYISDTIRGMLPADKRGILYIDTEQAEYDTLYISKQAIKLAGGDDYPHFKPAELREHSTEERKKIFEYYMDNLPGLGFVVIDGVRDFVKSVNNEEDSKDVVDWIMKLSSKKKCHILCVIHENKVGNSIRGHLGTELQNKAQTVFGVSKPDEESEISIVSARETRHKPFKPFAIGYDPIGKMPAVMHEYEIKAKSKSFKKGDVPTKKRLEDYSYTEHCKKLKEIFDELGDRLRNSQLKEAVRDIYGAEFYKQDANRCAQYFLDEGLLENNRNEQKNSAEIRYWMSEDATKATSPF